MGDNGKTHRQKNSKFSPSLWNWLGYIHAKFQINKKKSLPHKKFEFARNDPSMLIYVKFSPLKWWKKSSNGFPFISVVAREVCGVPTSSACIGRNFSTATDVASSKRNRLKLSTFSSIMKIKYIGHLQSPSERNKIIALEYSGVIGFLFYFTELQKKNQQI